MTLQQINRQALFTIIYSGCRRSINMWKLVIFPPVLTAILYFVIFGRIIGGRIGDMHGFPYVTYILPGLVMMSVINSAYAHTSFTLFLDKFTHSFDDLLVSPVYNIVILLGYIVAAILRSLIVGSLVLCVSLLFTKVHIAHVVGTLLSMCLAGALFACAGLYNALLARNFDDINIVPIFILTPLIYLGGVFYPLSALPGLWRYIAYANPIAYIISGMRYTMLGLNSHGWVPSLVVMLVMIIGFLVVMNHMMSHSGRVRA